MASWLVYTDAEDEDGVVAVGDSYNLSSEHGIMRVTFYRNSRGRDEFNKKLSSFGLSEGWSIIYESERE